MLTKVDISKTNFRVGPEVVQGGPDLVQGGPLLVQGGPLLVHSRVSSTEYFGILKMNVALTFVN